MLFCVNFWSTFYITKWVIACVYMICIACQSLTKCLCCLMQFLFCLSWMSCRYMHAINFFGQQLLKVMCKTVLAPMNHSGPLLPDSFPFSFYCTTHWLCSLCSHPVSISMLVSQNVQTWDHANNAAQ